MRRPWLVPLMPLYAAGLALRDMGLRNGWQPIRHLRHPVISIGNLSTGGTGKTPFAIALARLLTSRGFHVAVLSRGYGRQSKIPVRVHPEGNADEFGDEPILIARETGVPVYVAPQRYDAGRLAEDQFIRQADERSADPVSLVHILDDGFQHRQLARDVNILLLNREDWRDTLLPAGNLRQPRSAIVAADVIALQAEDSGLESELRDLDFKGSVWHLQRRVTVPRVSGPVAAFCGIARPSQFFAGLRGVGLDLTSETAFPDHHRYTAADIDRLRSAARAVGAASIFTTEKDLVRLGALTISFPPDPPLHIARLTISIGDEEQALDWLVARLAAVLAAASL